MKENRPLWAPWRIKIIREKKEKRCFMCDQKKPAKHYPEEELIVHRGKQVFVILNRYPYNSGHLLIVPYRHVADIAVLTKTERLEIMDLGVDAKNVLDKLMHPDGYNVGFNLGPAAGAGIADHIHMHLVPRWVGDCNFMPVIGDSRVVPEALETTAKLIRDAWV